MNTQLLLTSLIQKEINVLLDESKNNLKVIGKLKNLTETDKKQLIHYKQELISTLLKKEQYEKSEQYWLQQFDGEIPILNLPGFKTQSIIQPLNLNTLSYTFSKFFLRKLKAFSQKQDISMFLTLMAGVKILLYRYTSQQDIIIITPIVEQENSKIENQEALYLNIIPVRTKLEEKNRFIDVVNREKETLLKAYYHQQYPFSKLIEKLNLKRDISSSALFNIKVTFQEKEQIKSSLNYDNLNKKQQQGYDDLQRETSPFELSYMFVEAEDLTLNIKYNANVYDSFLIEKMFSHFENLLIAAIDNSTRIVEDIDYLSPLEKRQLVEEFNNTEIIYYKNKTIIDLFEEQVEKTPNKIALIFEEKELTYKELNEQANQLEDYLRKKYSIQPDNLIAIKLKRSEKMIVAMLGVLKSGAAYVTIDPNYPQERIEYIENDIQSKVIIDEVELDSFFSEKEKYTRGNLHKINSSSHLAYVIYTSGTTGSPKGVMVENNSLTNYILTFINYFQLKETDVVLSQSSISFDTSIEEIFPVLTVGGKLVVAKDNKNFNSILSLCEKHGITLLSTNPYIIGYLNADSIKNNLSITRIISGGDILTSKHIDNIYKDYTIYNSYGPTETTVCVSYFKINELSASIPIGCPISNTQIYILEDNLKPVPIGVFGKLYISGAGLARGYLNNPELTAEKFIDNPFIPGTKMYDTGDLGRWLPDGNIEFLGRKDQQVKIRGYRIELSEIENVLSLYSKTIKQVVVAVKELHSEKTLVAYYVAETEIDKIDLRNYLLQKLPVYMVPNFYVASENIPLTSNGKVNRQALPDITTDDLIKREYVAPGNETEQKLTEIWAKVLNLNPLDISTHSNFFEIGGTSLTIIKMVKEINESLDVNKDISPVTIFEYPSIKHLSEYILRSDENSNYLEESINNSIDVLNETLRIINNPAPLLD